MRNETIFWTAFWSFYLASVVGYIWCLVTHDPGPVIAGSVALLIIVFWDGLSGHMGWKT